MGSTSSRKTEKNPETSITRRGLVFRFELPEYIELRLASEAYTSFGASVLGRGCSWLSECAN